MGCLRSKEKSLATGQEVQVTARVGGPALRGARGRFCLGASGEGVSSGSRSRVCEVVQHSAALRRPPRR